MIKSIVQSIDPLLSLLFMTGYAVMAWFSINKILIFVAISAGLGQTVLGSTLEMLDALSIGYGSIHGMNGRSDTQFLVIMILHGLLAVSAWFTVSIIKTYIRTRANERFAEYELWIKNQHQKK